MAVDSTLSWNIADYCTEMGFTSTRTRKLCVACPTDVLK